MGRRGFRDPRQPKESREMSLPGLRDRRVQVRKAAKDRRE